MIRIAIAIIVLLSSSLFSEGQKKSPSDKKLIGDKPTANAKRSLELENLINDARSLPAEFAADILVRVAASNIDAKWKQEILPEAFALTANVQNKLRLKAKPGTPVDTRVNYRSYAFDLKLDALSLRGKIISEMAVIDKAQALRMLGQISPSFPFDALSCSDQMVYEIGDFYTMLETVTRAVHDEREIQQGERFQFLLPYVEGITSPAQIAPVSRMIRSLHLTNKELFILSDAFAGALKQIAADDRSFTAALTQDRTATYVFELIQEVKKEGGAANEVANAFRNYVSRHLSGVRCEDNVKEPATELPRHIKEMNYYFSHTPFTLEDLRPSKVEKHSAISEYFETKEAIKLSNDFKDLRGYDDEPDTKESETSSVWQERMLNYLRQLEDWDGRGESSEMDYFHQKCVLYFALAKLVTGGPMVERVMTSYINFLYQPTILKESRIEWQLHARELLGLVQAREGAERAKLLDLLVYSKNPILQMQARLISANIR